ncbi:MAG: Do family serine endopeptidase [Elusimicrobia bacterium]|nr:Do family serine endopeptidase [Candidatus Obscuribacterium magneticum]
MNTSSNKKLIIIGGLFLALILLQLSGVRITKSVSPSIASAQTTEQTSVVPPAVLNLQDSFSQVSENIKPAVVNITSTIVEKVPMQENPFEFFFWDHDDPFNDFFNMPNHHNRRPTPKMYEHRIAGGGSGVIIDPEGYILTNEHVVHGADDIKVTLPDEPDNKIPGKVIGRDERADLAILKIKPHKKLPYARLGDSSRIKVGDWAIAIGSPFGLEQTVTVGIISATRQNVSVQGRSYRDFIQTDAAINPGNSGGPLVNIHGEIIGINTAIFTPNGGFAGIGFAIPVNQAKEIIPQLREKGKVVRGWMGITLGKDIDEATAKVFGVPDKEGALIESVLPNYPAANAGLKRGDIIREFDGKKIKNDYELQAAVAETPPNKKVLVKIIRQKKEMEILLTVSEAPASIDVSESGNPENQKPSEHAKAAEKAWLGATFTEPTASLRDQYGIAGTETGLIIVHVEEGSKAEEIGLAQGDLMRSINQEPVANMKEFTKVITKIKTEEGIVFDILRQNQPIYLSYMGSEK